jgi:NTP-dependent ternary system trypsin peptidase co-occuring protein
MRTIPLTLQSGGVVEIEVASSPAQHTDGTNVPLGNFNNIVEKLGPESFERALSVIHPTVQAIGEKLDQLSRKIEEVVVEFSIKFSATGSIIIASGSGEANFKIGLKWKPQS